MVPGEKSVAALLDTAEDEDPLKAQLLLVQLARKIRKDVLELSHPDIAGMTPDTIKEIRHNTDELREKAVILVRLFKDIESKRLSEMVTRQGKAWEWGCQERGG